MNLDNYLNSYLDRRMVQIIEDWQLGTKSDISEISRRYRHVRDEVESLKTFERESKDRMDRIEERLKNLREHKP